MPESVSVTVRIADIEAFQQMCARLLEIADADGWASAGEVREQVRGVLEAFVKDSP